MSAGLKTLLEAAQYLEQQERLILSPQSATPAIFNELGFNVHYENHNGNSSHSVNNNIISTRNTNTRHTTTTTPNQVSSSAPAAGATFQHVNALTITSSGGIGNSQLGTTATNVHNEHEFSNGNAVGLSVVATTAAATNGRTSETHMSEDACTSSHLTTSTDTSPKTNSPAVLHLLPAAAAVAANNTQQQQEAQNKKLVALQQLQHNRNIAKSTTFTLVASNAAASKQMLLNGGIRIASPAATIGGATKAISIQPQQQQQLQAASSLPTARYKTASPLTPPPMSSRKLVETHARIRSFSLSSHKISANQLLLHNGSNGSHHMIVDDPHMSYVSGGSSSSNHSPPRHGSSGGSHYMQMMSSAQQGGSQVTHATPPIGGSGRRRTISSNSNGAGTREVHNKLEKNRRAHLKECYIALKNQLQLKDEDRKKTSNLAILSEASKHVAGLQKQEQDLETHVEQLAKEKINLQKRINGLKRELGPKYEQMFSGIFPDIELSARENLNDSVSLSSGRGSMLYSSSSSLSSGGSNGSNTMSSPVGAGLQTAMPTTISPVISKINSSNTSTISSASANVASPISPNNVLQHLKPSASVTANISPAGSPTTAVLTNGGNSSIVTISGASSLPLSLTAKNISATSLTRGSPTPSTPSPSPSSSSGVSSSSSFISSSPPMNGVNGVINGRNVTNISSIPNGLKYQTSSGVTIGTIGNGTATAAATIIATTAPGGNIVGGANSNNAPAHSAFTATTTINGYRHAHSRKTSLSYGDDVKSNGVVCTNNAANNVIVADAHVFEDSEQPASKFIKVFENCKQLPMPQTTHSNGVGGLTQLQLSQVVGGGNLVVSPYNTTAQAPQTMQKLLLSGGGSGSNGVNTNEVGRLPGGAELNILPTINVTNGIKLNGNGSAAAATAFYHANGKLTLMNGSSTTGGILLQDHNNAVFSVATTATGLTPLIVTSSAAPLERLNGKLSLSVGGQAQLPLINMQYHSSAMKPMAAASETAATRIATTTTAAAGAEANATLVGMQSKTITTNKQPPTFSHDLASIATSVNSLLTLTKSNTSPTLSKTKIATTTAPKTVPPITSSTLVLAATTTTTSSLSATMTTSATTTNAVVTGTTNGNAL